MSKPHTRLDDAEPVTGRTVTRDFVPPVEFDDYVIVRELGRGQMGQVYLAEDALLARPVAIKFIAGVDPDLEARQRFLLEARAAARIQHPNVVGVYRVGELGDRPYIVSELVRGKSIADLPRPMPWTAALDLAIELARGLAAAHRRGVIHCDIKPANAMLTDDGVAKLVDFGLSRVVAEGGIGEEGTTTSIVGTPDYLAPEVWGGRAPSRRSDVYSFGGLLFTLIAGAPPFGDVAPSHLAAAVVGGVAPDLALRVPEVDARLARVIARCLERDPELRFASGEELREVLEQLHPSRSHAVRRDENPYRGLRTFEAAHRGLFFGRGLEIGALVERLRSEAIVIVTGDSGVGKSSLCRAGVVPAVLDGALGAGRTWEALTMIPGRRPLSALASAVGDLGLAARVLADPEELPRELQRRAKDRGEHNGIVLFVDQMEELVTVGDPVEVAALDAGLARISEGVPGIRLITTVRADFLSRIATLPRLGRELSRLLYFVSPLPPERIRDVVTGPAQATGVEFESPALVSSLVDATTEAGSGGLPLLSFALAELWERRDRDLITQAALDAMGGVAGALARHGDSVIARMSPAERANVRRVLLRLVTAVGTRVRRTEDELRVSEGTRAALDALVAGRLLVVHHGDDGTTYELAHEVLVQGWGTLREWLDNDAEDRARRERIAIASAEWTKHGRRGDLTWRGPRLAEAATHDVTELTAVERAFIAASVRGARRRRWVARLTIASVLSLLVVVYAVQRHLAGQRLVRAVAVEVDAARSALAEARLADRQARELATTAYARFDAADPAAEAAWRDVLARRAAAAAAYRRAAGRLEAALAKDPLRTDVRAAFADILDERARVADQLHDVAHRDELLARLPAYDTDGSRRARWAQPGRLIVEGPPAAQITLVPEGRVLGTGRSDVTLPPGTYTIELTAPGHAPLRTVTTLTRGASTELALAFPLGPTPEGYIFIPSGTFQYGTSADEMTRIDFFQTSPLHPRSTDAFWIGRTEVTIGEWLAYVDAVPGAPVPNIPAAASGAYVIDRDQGAWRLTLQPSAQRYSARWGEPIIYKGRTNLARHDWRRFPITGISAREVEGYAGWLDRTGRLPGARLCTELEWTRAARGADGRNYPHGDRLDPGDASFDLAHGREHLGPDEVGSHPRSTSPFGLVDTSGNAFEWTRGTRSEYIASGGSYYHDRKTANLANRYVLTPDTREGTLGARMCASPRAN